MAPSISATLVPAASTLVKSPRSTHIESTVLRIRSVTSVAIPSGGEQTHIFDSGGGQKFAEELQAPLLGQVPIDPRVCAGGDAGEPLTRAEPNSTVGMFTQIKTPLNATFSPSV